MDENTTPINEGVEISENEADSPAESKSDEIDYASVLNSDIEELRSAFPELGEMDSICELADPVRFGALRDLGLTAKEAYLASGGRKRVYDNRAHLVSSVPGSAKSAVDGISRRELDMARDLFSGMSESEIQRLYRKVTK